MKPRIDEALDYLGGCDHRYQTSLTGGLLLLVTQYVFLYADSPGTAGRALGVVSAALLLGYVVTVIRHVSAGNDQPPRFTPVTLGRLGSIGLTGLVALVIIVVVVLVMYEPFRIVLIVIQNRMPPSGKGTPLLNTLRLLMNVSTYVYILALIPYVVVAVLLLFGRIRSRSVSRLLDGSATADESVNPVTRALDGLSELRILVSREYAYAWLLAVVLLVFNTDFVFFISDVVFDNQIFQPEFDTGTTVSAFFSFYFAVSIAYLFADVAQDLKRPAIGEERSSTGADTDAQA